MTSFSRYKNRTDAWRLREGQATSNIEPKASTVNRICANLFFFFFTAQILSPYVNGNTIYIEIFIAVITPGFWLWMRSQPINNVFVIALLLLVLGGVLTSGFTFIFKLTGLVVSILYCIYSIEAQTFYLFRYLLLSIGIASIQYVLVLSGSASAQQWGPEAISQAVWGEFATPTYTNFYAIIGDNIRVSGLSREGGFFASLLAAALILLVLLQKGSEKSGRLLFRFRFLTLIYGVFLSLSKSTFAAIPSVVIALSRRVQHVLNLMPAWLMFSMLFGTTWIAANANKGFIGADENVTYLHRFAAYLYVQTVDLWGLIVGGGRASGQGLAWQQLLEQYFEEPAGAAGFIVHYGALVVFLWLLVVTSVGIRGAGTMILFFGTSNVDFMTNQNFVVLAYVAALAVSNSFSISKGSTGGETAPEPDRGIQDGSSGKR